MAKLPATVVEDVIGIFGKVVLPPPTESQSAADAGILVNALAGKLNQLADSLVACLSSLPGWITDHWTATNSGVQTVMLVVALFYAIHQVQIAKRQAKTAQQERADSRRAATLVKLEELDRAPLAEVRAYLREFTRYDWWSGQGPTVQEFFDRTEPLRIFIRGVYANAGSDGVYDEHVVDNRLALIFLDYQVAGQFLLYWRKDEAQR